MLRVQAGDLEAFAQLVGRFENMVYGLAMSILRRPEDAEEATQDTFLKVFRARHSFDDQKTVEPWLLRIAGNASRDRLRRRKVSERSIARSDEGYLLELSDPDADGLHDRRQRSEHVASALGHLSEKIRLPLELKYLRGLTNQQIAASLDISISNVKVQIARGKDILASRLSEVQEP